MNNRIVPDATVSQDDINIALAMEAKGSEVPDSLKPALEEYKKNNPDKFKKDEPKPADDATPADPAPKPAEVPAVPKKDPEPKKGDEEGDEEDDEEGDRPVGDPNNRRPVRYIPIKKYKSEKEAWKSEEGRLIKDNEDLKKKVEDLSKAKAGETAQEYEDRIAKAAEQTGFAKDDLKTLLDFIKGEVGMPEDLIKKLKEAPAATPAAPAKTQAERDAEIWAKQDESFAKEFTAATKEANADPEMANHMEAVKKIAFTPTGANRSIWEIWTRIVKPKVEKKAKSPDGPGGLPAGGSGDAIDFETLANDPQKQVEFLRGATVKQKGEFSDFMGKRSRPVLRRNGKPVNQ